MASKIVHNISGHPSSRTRATCITIGEIKIRPGKHAFLPEESLTKKVMNLHGIAIWVGSLPKKFLQTETQEKKPLSMAREEVTSYLKALPIENLKSLNNNISIPFTVTSKTTKRFLVHKLTAACFSDEIVVDPEKFFWLGKWKKLSNGDYKEI